MAGYVIRPESGFINLSPLGFRRWAGHYLKCFHDFQQPDDGFSPVPYFLLCRSIELHIKALHLETKRQRQVKNDYGHNLVKAFDALPESERVAMAADERAVFEQANTMYKDKGFEYFAVMDAATAFKRAPRLRTLESLAARFAAQAAARD